MLIVDEANAVGRLRELGWIGEREPASAKTLTGGVSNCVLYVSRPETPNGDFVFKQARPQLRVPEPWFCGVDRVWREVAVLRWCQRLLSEASAVPHGACTPRVLHEDREDFAFTMTAAPLEHRVWRADLLAGRCEPDIAAACGGLLGALHARSWDRAELAAELDDRQIFDELRLDPYYRFTSRAQPAFASHFTRLIDDGRSHRHCLVHADFSPKNLLVFDGGLMLVDFETGHYGDPAFDLGFFLAHLMLKAFYHAGPHAGARGECARLLVLTREFWTAYERVVAPRVGADAYAAIVARGVSNLAGCAWARIDGKSKVDYLTDDLRREAVRAFCRDLFVQSPGAWSPVLELAEHRLAALPPASSPPAPPPVANCP
jgi:tRNA A-37 threonylcarbamoyl transferase component Bud32